MAVTIKDVARSCGMSVSTVSKVFNGYSDISDETRRQVMETAREIGYRPNALARALKTNRSYNLGVLFVDENISGLTHPFFAAVLNAFKAEAERRGYDITFINHNIGSMDMTYLEHCRYRNVDGVCLACVDFYSSEVVDLVNSDFPCVTIDHLFSGRTGIISDNLSGMGVLVDRAVALGHRRLAYIHGQRNSAVTENRILGFCRSMADHGISVQDDFVIPGRYDDYKAIEKDLVALLSRPDRPTCVLLPDDASYFGALDTVRGMGLRVPEDVSIAGYDGIRSGQEVHPRLTTVKQDSEAMGREAAHYLIERIDHPGRDVIEKVLIPTVLIEGQSLGAVPGS
ncbi:MAG: LacI family DNA-binding transcriptional regulator [Clostridia bacterium]|nr:LacI family DNA-binding transcriptional regulator [Clostridia bacterium]